MSYMVKEMFLTLQGEGGQAGRPAVFCRFAGCNLWSGREADRAEAICQFCDTDFIGTDGEGGGKFETAEKLAETIASFWPESGQAMTVPGLVVFTGGEPLLQLDAPLIKAMHARNFFIAVESNGTLTAPEGVDWLCISPKAGAPLEQKSGMELKLVYPQTGLDPATLEQLDFQYFWLQPMDGPNQQENTQAAIRYCLAHPKWGLSLQTHKLTGIP
ncbi:7-carboxy-7-deazaguanine synthase [Acetobacter persici]|uniref:7-carboxy-7-deazaguanine synthase n=1 Tax=Acetobacter persici TaxID=1076596 RepID=A0A6V8I7B0_9PROT|nr:7-carboxy-7-deazaguanine synthase [Acetobacter persici]OUI91686.1 7-cyano-7-deazaguanine reductase [Acetobacter persici]GFE92486.1 7-carboxy-7-deazaguanine synthase [Acetobacter persici]